MQQVNLYLPELRTQRDYLSASYSAAAVLVLAVCLSAFYLVSLVNLHSANARASAMEAKSSELKQLASDLKAKPSANKKTELEQEISQLRESIHNRQAIEGLLSGKDIGNKSGFSEFLAAISQALPEGLSLESFAINKGGAQAKFHGGSLRAENIPLFFANLQQQAPFAKTIFGSLLIEHTGSYLSFQIGPQEKIGLQTVLQ